ncbi:serine protease filzig isoform X2 [Athalia rosae]|nr:serine protease filzig isoform X2 [Athalia rosae]
MTPRKNMRAYIFLTIFVTTISAFSVSYTPQAKGRKLFGGYRIVPKECRPTNPSRIVSNEPPMCMFNYECTQRNGEVVGACMDGFLFGACCQLPAKQEGEGMYEIGLNNGGGQNVYEVDQVPDIPILLNPDGTPMGVLTSSQGADYGQNGKPGVIDGSNVNNPKLPTLSDVLGGGGNSNTKFSTFEPSTPTFHYADTNGNAEKTQIPQVDVSHLETDFPALLHQQSILDDLRLPGLITHSDSNNDLQDHQEMGNVDTVTTFLNPDQVLQIADPVDQLPVLFAQGLSQNNHSSADTVLLNKNGSIFMESNNPDDLFVPGSKPNGGNNFQGLTRLPVDTMHKIEQVTQKVESLTQKILAESDMGSRPTSLSPQFSSTKKTPPMTDRPVYSTQKLPSVTYELYSLPSRTPRPTAELPTLAHVTPLVNSNSPSKYPGNEHSATAINEITSEKYTKWISTLKNGATTPMTPTTDAKDDDLIRVPMINYDAQSGNKKDDAVDHEENSINHIISLLNNSDPSPEPEPLPEPNAHPDPHDDNSGIQTWVSIDGTSVAPPKIRLPSVRPSGEPEATTVTFPYTFYKPNQGSVYYDYEVSQQTENPDKANTHGISSNTYAPVASTHGSFDSSSSTQTIYSNRPSTNPPAPTVIVLGPLGTEFITKVDHKTPVRRPTTTTQPTISKKPTFSTTITHNINTVISTNNAETNNTRVVSSSYISVDLKDGTTSTKPVFTNTATTPKPVGSQDTVRPVTYEEVVTKRPDETIYQEIETKKPPTTLVTLSTWSEKPTFHLKPSYAQPGGAAVTWPEDSVIPHNPIILNDPIFFNTEGSATPSTPEDETAAPDEFNNFPPVRNPNLNMSLTASQQEKPTIVETFNQTLYPDFGVIDDNEIPTPAFIEDEVLGNKVDNFVNKIVESLQSNFDDLGEVIYKKKNATTPSPSDSVVTKKPTAGGTTKKPPTRRPATPASSSSQTPTKKPTPTKLPPTRVSTTTQKTVTPSNKPVRPNKVSTLKPKPTPQSSSPTSSPQVVTKRPKPVRKPTVSTTSSTEAESAETERPLVSSTEVTTSGYKPNYKRDCGVRPLVKTGRIVGGKGAKFGKWPWQVLVREATWLGLFTKNKCGGVLITNKYVTTAAHCQPGFLASLVAVLGEFDITGERESKTSVSRNVRRVIVHRNYDPATFENDLAVLELESPVQFDTHIVPICMPEDKADFTGRMATVTGWGRLKYNGGIPSILQEVQVPIMENSVCQEMFQTTGHSKLILDSFLCAGYANGQKDSCEGDSGGPLMLERPDGRWELAGTVSHGIKCAAPYLPGVYMRTTYFKPWLHTITGV